MEKQQPQNQVYIGTYTLNGTQHPSVFHYDPNTQSAESILSCANPSYIVCHDDHIYIASQIQKGEIVTLNSKHQILSRVSTLGNSPCHLSVNPQGTYLTVCNYMSGSVAVFMLENHIPTKIRCFITHEGSSLNEQRQSSPHPHCSVFSEQGDKMFVTDLGTDVVYFYEISEESVKVEQQKSIKMPGCGPRTVCRGRKGQKKLFVSCQLDNTIRMLSYEKNVLELVIAYRISSNPQNFPSEISYWRNQVYVALRGDDMIMVFSDQNDKLVQKIAFKVGKFPRHFIITEYGVMYVSCQNENKVYRYLFKDEKILQIGELNIDRPTVTAIVPSKN